MRVGLVVSALVAALAAGCGPTEPASLVFVDLVPAQPRLGEILTVHFRALDYRGLPQAGVPVTFALQTEKPGVTLGPAAASTTKGEGIAETQVTASGSVAGIVVVATTGSKVATSPPITFAGSVPNGRQFTFECGPIGEAASGGVRAIGAYDEARSLIAGIKVECTAHVGDRNGDGVPGALVSYETEAGTINPTVTSIPDQAGNATVLYKTSFPLPRDVAPATFDWTPENDGVHTGELLAPLWMEPWQWKANPVGSFGSPATLQEPRRSDPIRPGITLNSRDNLVSMIAVTAGEEGFIDVNQDGTWNAGEPFDDLTEPFVDENDNGTWDADERYSDANGNGRWDGKNGTWDASTLIWVQNRLLWTGIPNAADLAGSQPVYRVIEPATPPAIPHFGFAAATFLLADPWFNSMAQNADSDGCTLGGDDEESVVKAVPTLFNSGRKLVYPAFRLVSFLIKDAHDPLAQPPDPPFAAPVGWVVPIECTTTLSPIDQVRIVLQVDSLNGTVL